MRIALSIPISLKEIAYAVGVDYIGEERIITHVTTDSRLACCGDLFVAIAGERDDGANYIGEAEAIGAYTLAGTDDATIRCNDGTAALLALAAHYKEKLAELKYTVAITGSVGKTTTKEILSKLLRKRYKTHKTHGNQNNAIGLSYTLLTAPSDCEALVVELGMNHSGEISALSRAVKPDYAIITNIGTAHIGNLGSKEKIAEAKLEILDGLKGKIIVPYGEELLAVSDAITYSIKSHEADVLLEMQDSNSTYELFINNQATKARIFTDAEHIAKCTSAAIAAALLCNLPIEDIIDFSTNTSDNIRQSLIHFEKYDVIDDSYNASFESFEAGMKHMFTLEKYSVRSVLIGDILELGTHAYEIHYRLGLLCSKYGIDKIYGYGRYSAAVCEGAIAGGIDSSRIFINTESDRPDISAMQILGAVEDGEVIYAKGSHKSRVSDIIDLLKKPEGEV